MFAFVTHETRLRPCSRAYSNAKRWIRSEPARLIQLTYEPPGVDDPDTIVLVGKGITFDSGGLSLKRPEHMYEMKGDMAGGAAVISATAAMFDTMTGVPEAIASSGGSLPSHPRHTLKAWPSKATAGSASRQPNTR